MKRNAGFSLIELLVALTITVVIVMVSLSALTQAEHASEGISLMGNMMENLRAGMNAMSRDFVLAGSGIPVGGISVPSGSGVAINRPGPIGAGLTFPLNPQIPSVEPGPNLGAAVQGPSDIVTIMYADSILFGPNNQPLNANAINDPNPPVTNPPTTPCNGSIDTQGLSATFDVNCVNISSGNGGIAPGDLIMFSNAQGNAIESVSSVVGQTVDFAPGDPFDLNGRTATDTSGTLLQLQSGGGNYPPTTATRIWMITYFLDSTNPRTPRLMRQVNFNAPEPVAEDIEGLQISYNFVNLNNPLCLAACTNQKQAPAGLTPNQMQSVNLFLAARSDTPFSWTKQYFRDNLATQISLRGLSFVNQFN